MPLASAVRIMVTSSILKCLPNSSAIWSISSVSMRWFRKPSTLMMLPGSTLPSFTMRSFSSCMGDSPSICLYFAWFYAKFDLFLLSRILPDFATVFAHKKKVLPPVDLHRTDKTRQTPRRGRTRRGVGHYFPSSLSAAASSQLPWKDSMSPASVRAARAGSMGISASTGRWWRSAASAVLPWPKR